MKTFEEYWQYVEWQLKESGCSEEDITNAYGEELDKYNRRIKGDEE